MRTSLTVAAALACSLCGIAFAASPARAESVAQPGAWQKHEYVFVFMGFTSTYSCDGLADQLHRLLLAAGARPDAHATPGACTAPFGKPDKFARADLSFYTLAPTAAATTGKEAGAGTWRAVRLAANSPHELGAGDCELVEQFREQVLPLFTTRNLDNHTTCVPHQLSGTTIDLKFEVFAAAPGPDTTVRAEPVSVYAYPMQGQSRELQAKDRSECESQAAGKSEFDPAQAAATPDRVTRRSAYQSALSACLVARGYSVR
jgi:hypothetical protein